MVDGLDSPLLTIGPIVNGLKGEYVCTVTDFIGQTVSKIINITPLGEYMYDYTVGLHLIACNYTLCELNTCNMLVYVA